MAAGAKEDLALDTHHADIVHDCAFDYYGERLATCSADGSIRIFDKREGGGWKIVGQGNGHKTAVLRLSWAHPQFGQVIASCSLDSTVLVWEERESVDDHSGSLVSDWSYKRISDSRAAVNDVEFAPRHFGLMLAAASADGTVRVYTTEDQPERSHWDLRDDFVGLEGGAALTCVSWNPGRFDAPTLVVGGEAPSLAVWGYSSAFRRWVRLCVLPTGGIVTNDVAWAPNAGRSYHLIAGAFRNAAAAGRAAELTDAGLAAGTVSLWRVRLGDDGAEDVLTDDDDDDEDDAGAASGAAAGAGGGRGGARASTAASSSTGIVDAAAGASGDGAGEFAAVTGVHAEHECVVCSSADGAIPEAWRLRWGVIGALLATTGDDGIVRLWRRRLNGSWSCAQTFAVGAGDGGLPGVAASSASAAGAMAGGAAAFA